MNFRNNIIIAISLMIAIPLSSFARAYGRDHRGSGDGQTQQQAINDVYVVLMILDGVPKEFLYGLMDGGDLPVMKRLFVENGARAVAGITTFPSQSASAYQSFITGLFGGRSGIPYLQWFDRAGLREIDYLGLDFDKTNLHMWNLHALRDPRIKGLDGPVTILEKLKGHPSATLYSEITRGATEIHPKFLLPPIADTFLWNRQDMLDRRPEELLFKLFKRKKKEVPRFALVGLYAADVFQHKAGAGTEDAKLALIQFDIFLGEFTELLKKRGLYDRTYIVVVSDHGMHDIEHNVDVRPLLEKAGLRPRAGGLKKKGGDFFLSERGVAAAHLYLMAEEGRPSLELMRNYPLANGGTVDVVGLLRNDPGLSLVVARDGNYRVMVYSKACEAAITKMDIDGRTYYGYEPYGCDPLGYCAIPSIRGMCDGWLYDDGKWFDLTWNERYSDAVVQLGQLFDDGRGGDIFMVPDEKGTFFHEKAATHGSLIREDMQTAILIHGPGVPNGWFGPVRTVDMYPMMLGWYGLDDDGNHDGKRVLDPSKKRLDAEAANMLAFVAGKEPSAVRAGFCKRFAGSLHDKNMIATLNREIDTRLELIGKYDNILKNLSKKDLAYPLVMEQMESSRNEIRRLEDVKALVQ